MSSPTTRRTGVRRLVALALAVPLIAAGLPLPAAAAAPAGPQAAAAPTEGLEVWYPLDEPTGTVVTDASGNGHDGVLKGDATWSGDALRFGGTNGHVDMPDNLLAGLSQITVSTQIWVDPAQSGYYFFYNLGNEAGTNPALNGHIFSTGNNSYRGAITLTDYRGEKQVIDSPAAPLPRGVWKHITYSINGDVHTLYEDGVRVATATITGTPLPSMIGGGTTTANYLGRSAYAADRYFLGAMRDFRIYDRALTGEEVGELAAPVLVTHVQADRDALDLGDTTGVIDDVVLPTSGANDTIITWASDTPGVVSNTGDVVRPAFGEPDATVVLTATISKGGASDTRQFTVVVLAQPDDQTAVDRDAAAIVVAGAEDARSNLVLPAVGAEGSTITWSSSDPSIVSAGGWVQRPAAGQPAATVELTATVTKGGATASRVITVTVPALATPAEPTVEEPAPLPPLGWNSWNTFFCNINEAKVRAAADAMVASGMRDAGYEYVVVDDCWQALERDAQGNLQADPVKFPSGMKALGDYIHGLGLKFGIYQAPVDKTCAEIFDPSMQAGSTGALGHEVQDANLFASWGVDYLKYDWCHRTGDLEYQKERFTVMRDALKATGRPIVYSINSNSAHSNTGPDYNWGEIADMWRTTEDITKAWSTGCTADCFMGVVEILDVQAGLTSWNQPGRYNDPDMLEVGNVGAWDAVSNQAHFGMWALMAAPLMAGNDITKMTPMIRDILTDPDLLEVNQDELAIQASRVRDDGAAEVWSKQMSDGSVAIALLNRGNTPMRISTTAQEVGAPAAKAYNLFDLWSKGSRNTSGSITASVPPRGAVFYRVHVGAGVQDQFMLQSAQSGRCADSAGGAAGYATRVTLWDCGQTGAQTYTRTGQQLMVGGMCLDVNNNGTADGTAVLTWACNGQPNQQWTMNPDGTIVSASSGKCLSHADGATGNGTGLVILTCAGGDHQKWTRAAVSDILADATAPVVSTTVDAEAEGEKGWFTSPVTVTATATDALDTAPKIETSSDGATWVPYAPVTFEADGEHSVQFRATDASGNVSDPVTVALKIDRTAPDVALVGGPEGTVNFGEVPAAPTCEADDATSGLDGCEVTGYSTDVGTHTVTATATDVAGLVATATRTYTVAPYTLGGFYMPVRMDAVNSGRTGAVVPLQFEAHRGATELTDIAEVASVTVAKVAEDGTVGAEYPAVAVGGTALRYDAEAGRYLFTWQAPTAAGTYRVTVTTADGSTIQTLFNIR